MKRQIFDFFNIFSSSQFSVSHDFWWFDMYQYCIEAKYVRICTKNVLKNIEKIQKFKKVFFRYWKCNEDSWYHRSQCCDIWVYEKTCAQKLITSIFFSLGQTSFWTFFGGFWRNPVEKSYEILEFPNIRPTCEGRCSKTPRPIPMTRDSF